VARRQARHLFVELCTIERTIELGLQRGRWWNVAFEGLPAIQWQAARDVLADEAPEVYDAVAQSYVEADLLNKAANGAAHDRKDEYDEHIRQQMVSLQEDLLQAKATLRGYALATSA
jgi:hypothetical protein